MGTRNTLMPLWKVVTAGVPVFTISGTVADGGGTGISGVTITLTGDASDTTTTAADGTWIFDPPDTLPPGSYTITPTKTNYIFYATSSAQTVTTANITGVDFVSTLMLLYDEFTTADAAPITSPRTCEPGPGTITIVDTGSKFGIAGGQATISTITGSGDPGFYGDLSGDITARTSGLAAFQRLDSGNPVSNRLRFGLNDSWSVSPNDDVIYKKGASLNVYDINEIAIDATFFSIDTYYKILSIVRSAGNFSIIGGKLYWVGSTEAEITDTLVWAPNTIATGLGVDTVAAFSLPANGYSEWNTEFGAATNVVESPTSGETTTSAANSWDEFTWTVAAAETLEWMIRRTSDSATWSIRCDQAGSTIKIIEINSGETERASTAQTWTDTSVYRVIAIADGNTIKAFVDTTAKGSYASAAFNNTVTGVKISGFAAGADLACWPIDVSALLPAQFV